MRMMKRALLVAAGVWVLGACQPQQPTTTLTEWAEQVSDRDDHGSLDQRARDARDDAIDAWERQSRRVLVECDDGSYVLSHDSGYEC